MKHSLSYFSPLCFHLVFSSSIRTFLKRWTFIHHYFFFQNWNLYCSSFCGPCTGLWRYHTYNLPTWKLCNIMTLCFSFFIMLSLPQVLPIPLRRGRFNPLSFLPPLSRMISYLPTLPPKLWSLCSPFSHTITMAFCKWANQRNTLPVGALDFASCSLPPCAGLPYKVPASLSLSI